MKQLFSTLESVEMTQEFREARDRYHAALNDMSKARKALISSLYKENIGVIGRIVDISREDPDVVVHGVARKDAPNNPVVVCDTKKNALDVIAHQKGRGVNDLIVVSCSPHSMSEASLVNVMITAHLSNALDLSPAERSCG